MAATVGAVAPEARVAAEVAVGLAVTGNWEVPGAVGVAARADEATGLVAAGPEGVAVTAGGVAVTAGGAVG